MPRLYPEEFRRRAELARQCEQPVSRIAAEFGIAQSALHRRLVQECAAGVAYSCSQTCVQCVGCSSGSSGVAT